MFAVVFACFSLILVADQSELGRVGAGFEQGGGVDGGSERGAIVHNGYLALPLKTTKKP